MKVRFRLESEVDYLQEGEIESIQPSSQIHDGKNVFIARATLENGQKLGRRVAELVKILRP